MNATLIGVAHPPPTTSTNERTGSAHNGIIVCPLRYEMRRLLAAGIGRIAEIECCGPGRDGVRRWFERNATRVLDKRWIMLVGLAGAIDPAASPGTAHVASFVIDPDGARHLPRLTLPAEQDNASPITSGDKLITTPADRSSLLRASGAQLVDQESVEFACCADRLGARWGIVRGISDGVDTTLPRRLDQWVDEAGRTRLGRMLIDLVRSPTDLPHLIGLGRASGEAMRQAASLAARLIEQAAGQK